MKKNRTPLLLILIQCLFLSSAFSQSLVPLASFSGYIMQNHAYDNFLYVVTQEATSSTLRLHAFNLKTGEAPKTLLTNLRRIEGYRSQHIKFIEANGKLYALANGKDGKNDAASIYEINGQSVIHVEELIHRKIYNAWVTGDRKKVFIQTFNSKDSVNQGELYHYNFSKKEGVVMFNNNRPLFTWNAAILGDELFFGHSDPIGGSGLWVSDGTTAGTKLLKSDLSFYGGIFSNYFFSFNSRVYFSAYNGSGGSMYWTDGTKVEALRDRVSNKTVPPNLFLGVNEQFAAVGSYVGGVITVDKSHNVETLSTGPRGAANMVNNRLYFATGNSGDMQLKVSDGTVKGTSLVSDMGASSVGSHISQIIENGNKAVFLYRTNSDDSKAMVNLWHSDGSAKRTKSLIDSLKQIFSTTSDTILSRTVGTMMISHKGRIYLNQRDSSTSTIYKVSNKSTKMRILAFVDEDADGEKDSLEDVVEDMELIIGTGKLKIWTSSKGIANINLDPGTHKVSSPIVGDGWKISGVGSSQFEIMLPRDQGKTINFAIQKTKNTQGNQGSFGYARQRCNFTVPFWLNVRNTGTVTSDIEMKLVLDSQVRYVMADVTPNSIDTVNHLVLWKFSAIKPLTNKRVKLFAKMPGVNSRGDKLSYTLYLTNKEGGVVKYSDTIVVKDSLGCSYDPNDKQVLPQRELGGVYKGEKLKYKIRFQNTGNDTALNVKLVDTLSRNLDWGSLKILGSSHPIETQLTDGGVLTFYFDDIYLADSNTNEPESHGFVDYRIKQKEDLKLGDEIENTAYIYFDFNPAIITNTTYNILVEPSGVADEVTGDDLIEIYPNPMDNQLNIRFENDEDRQIEISNSVGMILHTTTSDAEQIQLETSQWSTGIYLIKVLEGKDTKVFKVIKE